MTTQSTAHYMLEGLCEIGVEYLFCNLGTDHAPIIEEIARWRRRGRHPPHVILCPHENVAVHMAGGYAMATGRGQAALVHVDAGTANAAMGLHNLYRSRVPLLLIAGKAPFTSHGELLGSRDNAVNYTQDNYDIASLVRPYVKWAYDLPSGIIVKEVLRRAASMMHSDAMAPVYLTVARETLAAQHEETQIRTIPKNHGGPVRLQGVDDATIAAVADRLIAARDPILITSYAGRQAETPALIERLATVAGIRVFEVNPTYLNVSRHAPCFAGEAAGKAAAETDFGLLVDVDVPWLPKLARENPESFWVHIDVDAVKKDFPLWEFPGDMRLQADSRRVLERLLAVLEARSTPAWRADAERRVARCTAMAATARAEAAEAARRQGEPGRIGADFACAELAKVMDDDAILLNEAGNYRARVRTQVPRSRPGTYFSRSGGGLGSNGGAALGTKLAHPKQLVVSVVGDGGFCLSNPTAVFAVARQYRLPFLTVVLDNSGWNAVKGATTRLYPQGVAVAEKAYLATYAEGMRWEKVAEASGAYGERVEAPEEMGPALQRCLAALRDGRAALVSVTLDKVGDG